MIERRLRTTTDGCDTGPSPRVVVRGGCPELPGAWADAEAPARVLVRGGGRCRGPRVCPDLHAIDGSRRGHRYRPAADTIEAVVHNRMKLVSGRSESRSPPVRPSRARASGRWTAVRSESRGAEGRARANARQRRTYAKEAATYDDDPWERRLLGTEHRAWCCSQAFGNTLEVAIGTGLNLPHYPPDVRLTGIDLTPEMLERARARAASLERRVTLQEGDAHDLPFADGTFDTVVCTYSLCSIPDDVRALREMMRVLRPGGSLILLDHTASTVRLLYWLQRALEAVSRPLKGEHWTRRPMPRVQAAGFAIRAHDRLRAGVVERLVAVKPDTEPGTEQRAGGEPFEAAR
jgi:SAM-dependent methyltransferase